jgi:hypothetical protein
MNLVYTLTGFISAVQHPDRRTSSCFAGAAHSATRHPSRLLGLGLELQQEFFSSRAAVCRHQSLIFHLTLLLPVICNFRSARLEFISKQNS